MKGKLIVVICIILVLAAGLMGKAYINGANTQSTGVTNPMSQFKSIAELQSSVKFNFMVPEIVATEKNISMYNYLNTMVEIKSDNICFRAAEYIGDGADVSGDYTEYPVDNKYTNTDGSVSVRYRTNNIKTLVNIVSNNIAYSISFNTYLDEVDALNSLDIDMSMLIPATEINNNTDENTQENGKENEINNNVENSTNENELTFKLYKVENSEISFMLPNVASDIKVVNAENQLAVILGGKLVFVIESTDYVENNNYNGYTITKLNDEYTLVYTVNNTFEKETQLYKDYYTIIENMETVVNTFNNN